MTKKEAKIILQCRGNGYSEEEFNEALEIAYTALDYSLPDNLNEAAEDYQQEQLPGIEDPGIPGKDFIPVDWVDACEKYGKWKIVKVK